MSSVRWKCKNATEQSFGGEHHFLCMLDTINGKLRTNNYYTGLCRENLLYTPTFEKKVGTHTYEIQCFCVAGCGSLRSIKEKIK